MTVWTAIGAAAVIFTILFTAIWRASAANLEIDHLKSDMAELKVRMTKKEEEVAEISKQTAVLKAFADGVKSELDKKKGE